MTLKLEGKTVPELPHGKVLGLTWSSDLSWTKITKELVVNFNKKYYGRSRLMRYLSYKRKRELAERVLISTIHY